MTHVRNNILNKRLPRGLGLIVLFFSLAAIFWLSRNAVLLGTKAAVGNIPKDLQISNISSTAYTVSYITDESVPGSVTYGQDANLGKVAFDVRDSGSPVPHRVHYVTIPKLKSSTKYFFSIVSGDKVFPDSSVPYEIITAASTEAGNSTETIINGQVSLDDGSMPTEAIAYVSSDNSQTLSTLLKPDGSYNLPLKDMLKKDLSSALEMPADTVLRIQIVNPALKSRVSVLASQTSPVPPVILSKDYDFSVSINALTSSASESAQITSFPTPEVLTSSSGPQILTPKTSQEFKDQQPLFEGKAIPGNDVEITIQSEQEITTTVQADSSGNWKFRPDTKLAPGLHTLTIKSLDASGIIKTLTQSFTVYAEGSQFVEPSISPTLPPSPTTPQSTPVPTVTVIPTTPPTEVPTPIIIITTPIVSTPSATTSPEPQITTPPIPQGGSSALLFGFIGIGTIIGIGSLLFFLL